ncbi:hypothetical protein CAOG_08452 [Capsaspora owczarzaki ATCC 30864]|uniref:hypothetical protein n=1 Tax=Capsaspora owczarzaki (strain ATCC 30864) TaxID=595528 RepID=UPI0003522C9B|nr:hypothetical protein CAOG_08452 [Capsaspora owczarzaki ATCC 30864]|eukprot:XP_011270024.1 hypothetical protein CAOG_08452 [Capsaspora owczarzaki ATCC 30864]
MMLPKTKKKEAQSNLCLSWLFFRQTCRALLKPSSNLPLRLVHSQPPRNLPRGLSFHQRSPQSSPSGALLSTTLSGAPHPMSSRQHLPTRKLCSKLLPGERHNLSFRLSSVRMLTGSDQLTIPISVSLNFEAEPALSSAGSGCDGFCCQNECSL